MPGWIQRCLDSVRRWAGAHGHAYRFVGDELFDHIPDAYRVRVGHSMQLMSDLARLQWIRRVLDEGCERVAWVDADVLVVAPDHFVLPTDVPHFVCREVWVEPGVVEERANNCVCGFSSASPLLDSAIAATEQRVRDAVGAIPSTWVGTMYFTELDRTAPLPKLADVGLWSPYVVRDVAAGGGPYLDALRARAPTATAVNLCASFRGKVLRDPGQRSIFVDDALFDAAIDAALRG